MRMRFQDENRIKLENETGDYVLAMINPHKVTMNSQDETTSH
jgi:hypothetical protein